MWTYNYIQNKLKRRREDERGLRIDLLSIRKSFRRLLYKNHELPYDELYCSSCNDSDELIGSFKNEHELKQLLEEEGVFDECIETIVRKWKAEEWNQFLEHGQKKAKRCITVFILPQWYQSRSIRLAGIHQKN